jgi:hypothetical protein
MSVAGVGAIGAVSGGGAVYALSPYLNGVVRTPDAVAAAEVAATAAAERAAQSAAAAAVAANAQAAAIAAPATPFANPAIADIAQQADVLGGDGGFLVQSYGAVALNEQPLALSPLYTQPIVPAIPPLAPVTRTAPAELALE